MLLLRHVIDSVSGLRFVIENLELKTGMGKNILLSQPFYSNREALDHELNNVEQMVQAIHDNSALMKNIQNKLSHLRDIGGTLNHLSKAGNLDDIALFEIKHFGLILIELSSLLEQTGLSFVSFPDLTAVIDLLDPEKTRLAHFYIHSLYSEELSELRKKYKHYQASDPEKAEALRQKSLELEDTIRRQISLQLLEHSDQLILAYTMSGYLDLVLAKALLAVKMKLCRPSIAESRTLINGLSNPHIQYMLQGKGKEFQRTNIELASSPALITGANMSGKTVFLKSIALCHYLFHFGFYVPAISAELLMVDEVILSIGDQQNELNGLSSFASEMLTINRLISSVKSGKKVLALIDEPARTTNPDEGRAIVLALIDFLTEHQVESLLTTHYNNLNVTCRRLRVRGLEKVSENDHITIENINDYMDYSILEHNSDSVPMDALRIIAALGIDSEFVQNSKQIFNKDK